MFKYAKSLGDCLVVGVDDDERVRASKGDGRPVNTLEDRIEMLESIKYIDDVVGFDCDSELDTQVLLSGAEIIVVGSDYKDKKVIGSRHVKEVKFFDKVEGYSTTKILEKI
jgi:D-beta-D-heptose 7-phosphate kinase/D-beta-D-heptose 1-phosphate adenosyltransferase